MSTLTLTRSGRPPTLNPDPTHRFNDLTFTSHDNRSCTLRYRTLATWENVLGLDGMTADEYLVYAILPWRNCPADSDCNSAHIMLLHARHCDGIWYVRDYGLLTLLDFEYRSAPPAFVGPSLDAAMSDLATTALASMQVPPIYTRDHTYVVTVYDRAENSDSIFDYGTGTVGTNLRSITVPATRRLITSGESIAWVDPNGDSLILIPDVIPDPTDPTDPVPTVDDEAFAMEQALRQNITYLEDANRSLRTTIDTAKAVAQRYTMDNGGCEAGKREFLADLGLHDEDEIDAMFSRDYHVSVDVPVTIMASVTVRVSASSAEDAEEQVGDGYDEMIAAQIDRHSLDFDTLEPDLYNASVTDVETAG